MNKSRVDAILKEMENKNMTQMLISDPASIFYLTGRWIHPGNRLLALYLNTNGNNKLFINEMFPVEEDLGAQKILFTDTDDAVEIVAKHIDNEKMIGIDKNWPAKFLLRLMELKGASEFVNGSQIVDEIRMVKDEQEKELMRSASKLNDIAVEKMINLVPDGHSEKKMSQLLASVYEELGADGFSFDPIIGYGANAADPHHSVDDSVVKDGDSVIIDIGCVKDSYCSDMTRTVFYKSVSEKSKEVYDTVLQANKKAIEMIKPGVTFAQIDAAARGYIESKGYGKYFTHRTGHCIGINCHDFGDVSAINHKKVEEGMIFSIEPGIYISGEVGVRIEDLVIVTKDGCEILNKYSKELTVIG